MKKIVHMELSFYVDSDSEGCDKMETITQAVDDVMDCKHGAADEPGYDDEAPCNMLAMSGQVMTEAQYDAWLDERYPESS
jgi:hypothetical protein